MYTRYANASYYPLSYTHVRSYVVRRVHPLGLLMPIYVATKTLLVVWHVTYYYYYTTPSERQPLPITLLNTHCFFNVPSNLTVG